MCIHENQLHESIVPGSGNFRPDQKKNSRDTDVAQELTQDALELAQEETLRFPQRAEARGDRSLQAFAHNGDGRSPRKHATYADGSVVE